MRLIVFMVGPNITVIVAQQAQWRSSTTMVLLKRLVGYTAIANIKLVVGQKTMVLLVPKRPMKFTCRRRSCIRDAIMLRADITKCRLLTSQLTSHVHQSANRQQLHPEQVATIHHLGRRHPPQGRRRFHRRRLLRDTVPDLGGQIIRCLLPATRTTESTRFEQVPVTLSLWETLRRDENSLVSGTIRFLT